MRNPRSHRGSGSGKEGGRRETVEASAPTVDEAIIKALTVLRSTKERTRIEVLDPGKSKLLGLFGGRPARVRATLRPRMEQSPLMDAPRFARNIEAAYRQMWRTWCRAQAPSAI